MNAETPKAPAGMSIDNSGFFDKLKGITPHGAVIDNAAYLSAASAVGNLSDDGPLGTVANFAYNYAGRVFGPQSVAEIKDKYYTTQDVIAQMQKKELGAPGVDSKSAGVKVASTSMKLETPFSDRPKGPLA